MRWILWASVLGVLIIGVAFAARPKPIQVETALASTGELRIEVREDARTRIRERYTVYAPFTGDMQRLDLQPGDRVKSGAKLIEIQPAPPPLMDDRTRRVTHAQARSATEGVKAAKLRQQRAQTALKFAAKNLERRRALVKSGSSTQAQLEAAELEHHNAKAELEASKIAQRISAYDLSQVRAMLSVKSDKPGHPVAITAPISGQVLRVHRQSAGAIAVGTPIIELGDPKRLEIVAELLTQDAVRVVPGAAVRVEAWGGDSFSAKVRRVEPQARTTASALGVEEQRVNVVIDPAPDAKGWDRLGDGFRVEVSVTLSVTPNVVRVPVSALFRSGESWAVYVVQDDQTATLRKVEVGARGRMQGSIRSGLKMGERVVLYPSERITEGALLAYSNE